MHQKVFGNKKKRKEEKKKKNNNKKKQKTNRRLATMFLIDFLFFILRGKKKSVYISEKIKINGQTPELAQDDWLESLLAEEMNVTVVVNHFLLLRLHWDTCL